MGNDVERTINMIAYERLKGDLAAKFAKGHFVGISLGRIVAGAARLDELIAAVRGLGLDPKQVLAVQAGIEIPHHAIILGALEVGPK